MAKNRTRTVTGLAGKCGRSSAGSSKPPEFALARQFFRGSGFRRGGAGRGVAYARPIVRSRPGRGARGHAYVYGRWVLSRGRVFMRFLAFQFVQCASDFVLCCIYTTCGATPLEGVPGCDWPRRALFFVPCRGRGRGWLHLALPLKTPLPALYPPLPPRWPRPARFVWFYFSVLSWALSPSLSHRHAQRRVLNTI